MQVAWCSSPTVLSRLQAQATSGTGTGGAGGGDYIGLLAVICGDGVCRVFLLPALPPVTAAAAAGDGVGVDVPVISSHYLCRFELKAPMIPAAPGQEDSSVQLTSVAWQPYVPPAPASPLVRTSSACDSNTKKSDENEPIRAGAETETETETETVRIACGLSSGGILVWDLPLAHLCRLSGPAAPLLWRPPFPCTRLHDLSLRQPAAPSRCTVTCLQYCPYNPRLLLQGGYDHTLKVSKMVQ